MNQKQKVRARDGRASILVVEVRAPALAPIPAPTPARIRAPTPARIRAPTPVMTRARRPVKYVSPFPRVLLVVDAPVILPVDRYFFFLLFFLLVIFKKVRVTFLSIQQNRNIYLFLHNHYKRERR